jgi:hypothetical protein
MIRPPFPLSAAARGVKALAGLLRRRAKASANRQRLDSLMAQVSRLRAERKCSEADLEKAGATYCKSLLAITRQGA